MVTFLWIVVLAIVAVALFGLGSLFIDCDCNVRRTMCVVLGEDMVDAIFGKGPILPGMRE